MTAGSNLRIARPSKPVDPPPDRGRLMNAYHVAEQVYGGARGPKWVLRNVPGKMTMGHRTVMWWEYDVIAWIDSKKDDA